MAEPSTETMGNIVTTGLSGPAVHVSDRSTNGHRKTSSPRPVAHETYTVAPQELLEGTGVPRKSDSNPQLSAPSFTMVATSRQRSPDLYRRIKRRLERSLKRTHSQRYLVTARKQTAYKLFGTQGSVSRPKRVPKLLCKPDGTCGNRQHYSNVVHKEGSMKSGSLCALLWRILTWCTRHQVTLRARHILGRLNVVADKLSRLGQTIQMEWSLLQEVFQAICLRWHRPQIDLFAERFNHKLPQFVSPVLDPLAVAVDALWMHTPSHQQPSWAKWWRGYRTTLARGSF